MALPKQMCFFAIHSMVKQVWPDCCAGQPFSSREGTGLCGLAFFLNGRITGQLILFSLGNLSVFCLRPMRIYKCSKTCLCENTGICCFPSKHIVWAVRALNTPPYLTWGGFMGSLPVRCRHWKSFCIWVRGWASTVQLIPTNCVKSMPVTSSV